jgi:CubicO group peptidase (beta-lactamase class C family)
MLSRYSGRTQAWNSVQSRRHAHRTSRGAEHLTSPGPGIASFDVTTMSYRRRFLKILLASCQFLLSISGHAPAHQNRNRPGVTESSVVRSLEKTIPQLMEEGEVPGLSIVLIRDAKIFWHRGFGVKNAETKAPIEDATVFEIASLTKPVLAYGALKLMDSGKLDLDTPLVKYLPGSYVEGDDRSTLTRTNSA